MSKTRAPRANLVNRQLIRLKSYKKIMYKRIFFNIALFSVIFYAPWWAVVVLAFAGAFLFPSYYEIILAGVLFDLLYGTSSHPVRGVLGLLASVVLLVAARRLRRAVR